MEQLTKRHLEDILEFEIAIKKMYLKLADLEYDGKTDSEEYQTIFSLLENARKIEEGKFANIYIDENAYERMKGFFTKDHNNTDILRLLENQDFIEGIRLNNIISIIAMQNNFFIKDEDLKHSSHKEELEEEVANRKYRDAYESAITRNTIFIVAEDIKKMTDDEVRKYFIYLKYLNIYISPSNEYDFLKNAGKVNPPLNIKHNKYQVPEYDDEEYDSCNRDNLTNVIVEDLVYILGGDDQIFGTYPYKLELQRMLSYNKARLITLQDKSFIILIKKTIDQLISEDEDYQKAETEELSKAIDQMFIESLEILDKIEEKRKLELK